MKSRSMALSHSADVLEEYVTDNYYARSDTPSIATDKRGYPHNNFLISLQKHVVGTH